MTRYVLPNAILAGILLIAATPLGSARVLDDGEPSSPAPALISATDRYALAAIDTCLPPPPDLALIVRYYDEALVGRNAAMAEPCCACGTTAGGEKGCTAIAKPCCCTAKFKLDGTLICSCQGGRGCAGGGTAA